MCIDTTKKYRDVGFDSCMNIAKSLASDMNIEPLLPTKRRILRKKQFNENDQNKEIKSAEKSFRVNYFLFVVDIAIAFLKDRFEQLKIFRKYFWILI